MKFVGVLGIAAAIVACARFGHAEPTPLPRNDTDARPSENNVQPVRLSYAADSDCPSKEDFVQAIRERGQSIRESDDAPRAMSVTLVRNSESKQWNGELRVHDANSDASREVTAASCDAAARSIALFASLALAPEPTDASAAPAPPKPIPPRTERNPSRTATRILPKKPADRAIAQPPRIAPDLLHRDRFFIGPETNFFLSSQMFEDFAGLGAVATYFFSKRTALGLSADWLHSFSDKSSEQTRRLTTFGTITGGPLPEPTSETALVKVMLRLPMMVHAARGTLDGRPGSPFDVFVTPSVGTIVTKPDGYPVQVSETYSPGLAGELDLGLRAFVSQGFSLTAQVGFLIFEERYLKPSYLVDSRGALRSATYHPSFYGNFGPLFQIGAEFDLPPARASR
jgi:hypothetical protein